MGVLIEKMQDKLKLCIQAKCGQFRWWKLRLAKLASHQ